MLFRTIIIYAILSHVTTVFSSPLLVAPRSIACMPNICQINKPNCPPPTHELGPECRKVNTGFCNCCEEIFCPKIDCAGVSCTRQKLFANKGRPPTLAMYCCK
ncbi:hypothetical protein BGW37DRAFT_506235 [Umbelopsis sp. PMI_123]|nr:hypothetical protein BGW37DRAFT_506235 [Umbelopsis sp. PMI_123]